MATLYPNGYAGGDGMGDMRTLEASATRTTIQRLDPEFWRRVAAMMVEAGKLGIPLGVGTGWRVQPNPPPPGFTSPCNSYHEGFMPDNRSCPDGVNDRNAMAVDMVPPSSLAWAGANAHRFGLVDFSDVNNEPWHFQPVEISRSRNRATARPALTAWPLPGDSPGAKLEDVALIIKATDNSYWYSTGTLYTALTVGRDLDIHRFMIGLSGGHTADVTGISRAEVNAGMIGMPVDDIMAKLNSTAAAVVAAATVANQVLAAANAAKAAAAAAQAAAEATLASVDDDDAALVQLQLRLAELRQTVEETQAAANAAETAAQEAKEAAEGIQTGTDFSKVKLVLQAEGNFEPLGTAEPVA